MKEFGKKIQNNDKIKITLKYVNTFEQKTINKEKC